MRHLVSQELFAYWDELRAGRAAPERSAVDPAAIRGLLAYTFLLEIEPGGAVSFRLSGTRLNALFHRDLKGARFRDIWTAGDALEGCMVLEAVLDDCTPAVAALRGGPAGYEPVDFELLLLPLRHCGRTHRRLLGSIAGATVPTWSGLKPIDGFGFVSFRTILPRDAGRFGTFGAAPRPEAPPERPGPERAGQARSERRPWPFRVYQGGLSAVRAADGSGWSGGPPRSN